MNTVVARVPGHVGMPDAEMSEPPLTANQIVAYDHPLIESHDSMEKHSHRTPISGLPALGRFWLHPDRTKKCVHLREKTAAVEGHLKKLTAPQ